MHLKALLNTNMSVWQLHPQSSEERNYKIVHNAALQTISKRLQTILYLRTVSRLIISP